MNYVIVKDQRFPTLLALTTEEQEVGLMHKPWPPPVMSFVYATPRVNKYWMHKTPSPLDIVFCRNSKIISICHGEPNSTRIIGPDDYSDLVVEFPHGTCKKSAISVGDEIKLDCNDEALMKILMLKSGIRF